MNENSYSKLQQPFDGLGDVHIRERLERILDRRDHPLLEQRHHDVDANENLQSTFYEKTFADSCCAREIKFIAERWCKKKIAQVFKSQIVRILHERRARVVFAVVQNSISVDVFAVSSVVIRKTFPTLPGNGNFLLLLVVSAPNVDMNETPQLHEQNRVETAN